KQTAGDTRRRDELDRKRLALESEVRQLEAVLAAKRAAAAVVAEEEKEMDAVATVRITFERRLMRLQERERLIEVKRRGDEQGGLRRGDCVAGRRARRARARQGHRRR
ncbi:unnamed protein product, partial [Phaeothamnion confervicola]